jgi:hypothetical protein
VIAADTSSPAAGNNAVVETIAAPFAARSVLPIAAASDANETIVSGAVTRKVIMPCLID